MPVAEFVAVTAALGMAAPVGSVTVPRILPVDCAEMRDTAPSDSSTAKPMYSSLRSFLFISSLSFKSSQGKTFDNSWFDVCVFTVSALFLAVSRVERASPHRHLNRLLDSCLANYGH